MEFKLVEWLEGFKAKGVLEKNTGVHNEDFAQLVNTLVDLEDSSARKEFLKQKHQGVYVRALIVMKRN